MLRSAKINIGEEIYLQFTCKTEETAAVRGNPGCDKT